MESPSVLTNGDEHRPTNGTDHTSAPSWAWQPPSPIQTFRFGTNFADNQQQQPIGGATPKSANSTTKSPIGTKPNNMHLRQQSYPDPKHIESSLVGGTGVSLTLEDDAEMGSGRLLEIGGKEIPHQEFLQSKFQPATLSTNNGYTLNELSPNSPSEYSLSTNSSLSHYSSQSLNHSQTPSREDSAFDAVENRFASMMFSGAQQAANANNNNHHGGNGLSHNGINHPHHSHHHSLGGNSHLHGSVSQPQSTHFGPLPTTKSSLSQQNTPYQSPMPATNLPTNNTNTNNIIGNNSPPGSVAYIVLPNGQVQTVDMATLSQVVNTNTSNTSTNTNTVPSRGVPTPPSRMAQPQSQYQTSYPPQSSASPFNDYPSDGPSVDADQSFSLETLSTKTLPLFSPPTPPIPQQSPPLHPGLNRPSSLGFHQSQQQQQHPIQPQPRSSQSQSHSPYSSPSGGMSMQSRRVNRALSQNSTPNLSQAIGHSDLIRNLGSSPSTPQPTTAMGIPIITPTGTFYSLQNSSAPQDSMIAQAKSQAGSRALQTKLQENNPTFYAQVFEEVYDALPELMVDLFGNYLVQKLITFANDTQRLQLLLKVLPELLEISCDRQGTRAIQKLIESLRHTHERQMVLDWLTLPMPGGASHAPMANTPPTSHHSLQIDSINVAGSSPSPLPISSPNSPLMSPPSNSPSPLSPSSPTSQSFSHPPMPRLIHLIRDQNGSHVVHSILDTFPPNMLHNIQRNAMKNCRSLGIDQHGSEQQRQHTTQSSSPFSYPLSTVSKVILCVLKKCLSMAPAADFIYFNLKMILEHILEYVNNQYGNYLIQHIIERTNGLNHAASVSTVSGGGGQASSHPVTPNQQNALNLVSEGDDAVRSQLHVINDAIFRSLRGQFSRLSRQKFSSNVVEKCLKIPDAGIRSAIIHELIDAESIPALLQCSYGNYVLQHVLYVANQDECAILFSRVKPEHVLASLRKNIRTKWERLLANAHLIHPGLAPGGVVAAEAGQRQQHDLHQPIATVPLLPSPDPLLHSSDDTSSTAGGLIPSPAACQLITSILGAGTPGSEFGSPATNPIDRVGTPTHINSSQSPNNLSPSMRGVQTTNLISSNSYPGSNLSGGSPNLNSRQFHRSHSGTHTPNNFNSRMAPSQPSPLSISNRNMSGGSNSGSGVNSPQLGNMNSPHLLSTTPSGGSTFQPSFRQHSQQGAFVNGSPATSPNVNFRSIGSNVNNGGGRDNYSNFPVNISSNSSNDGGGYHHPTSSRSSGGFNAHASTHISSNNQQLQQQQQQQKYLTNPTNSNSSFHRSVSPPSNSTTVPDNLQQQIQQAQSQLQALMALQQQAQQQQQQQSHHPQQNNYGQQY